MREVIRLNNIGMLMNSRTSRVLRCVAFVFCLVVVVVGSFAGSHAQDEEHEHTIKIFPNQDSLYIYVPAGIPDGYTLDLTTFCFEAVAVDLHCLGDYQNFQLAIANLSVPICFEFVRGNAVPVMPFECGEIAAAGRVYSESVINADAFWYDSTRRQGRTMNIRLNGAVVGMCPAGAASCAAIVPLEIGGTTVGIATEASMTPVVETNTTSPSATTEPSATFTADPSASPTSEAASATSTQTPTPTSTPTVAPASSGGKDGSDSEEPESNLDKITKIAESVTKIIVAITTFFGFLALVSERFRQIIVGIWRRFRKKDASKDTEIKHEGLHRLGQSLNVVIEAIYPHNDGYTFRFKMEFVPTDPQATVEAIEQQVRIKADALGLPTLSGLKVSPRAMTRNADRIRIEGYIIDRRA